MKQCQTGRNGAKPGDTSGKRANTGENGEKTGETLSFCSFLFPFAKKKEQPFGFAWPRRSSKKKEMKKKTNKKETYKTHVLARFLPVFRPCSAQCVCVFFEQSTTKLWDWVVVVCVCLRRCVRVCLVWCVCVGVVCVDVRSHM